MTGAGVWQDHSTDGRQNIRVRMWPPGNGVGRRRRVLGQMQSSSMQRFMLVYEEVRRLETGRAPQVGRIGWCEGGQPTSHTPTDSLDTHRGRRYMQILAHFARPGHSSRQRAPCLPACTFPRVRTGTVCPGPGSPGRCKWVPTCLGRLYCGISCPEPVSSRRARPARCPFVITVLPWTSRHFAVV